jgi:hypothetical protein
MNGQLRAVQRDAPRASIIQPHPASRRTSTDRGETEPAAGASGGITRCGREWGQPLLNPGSPPRVSLPLVGLCARPELLEVARGADVPVIQRITANELAERRPPLFGENARDSDIPDGMLQ